MKFKPAFLTVVFSLVLMTGSAQFATNPVAGIPSSNAFGSNFSLTFNTNHPVAISNAPVFDTNHSIGWRTNSSGFTYNPTDLTNAGVHAGVIVPPPAAPTHMQAYVVSSSQINLAWTDNATNEIGFKIERKTGSGGTYAQIGTNSANSCARYDTGLEAGTQYYYRVRAFNNGGNSSYGNETNATTTAASGSGITLLDYYSFESDGTDSVGSQPLTDSGDVTWGGSGVVGNCAEFNGVNNLSASSFTLVNPASFTFSGWFYLSSTWAGLFGFDNLGGDGSKFLALQSNGDQQATQGFFNNDYFPTVSVIADTPAANTWAHFVVTYDGTTLVVYVNGVQKYSQDIPASAAPNYFIVGNRSSLDSLGLSGKADEISIYSGVATLGDVTFLYNGGAGRDESSTATFFAH